MTTTTAREWYPVRLTIGSGRTVHIATEGGTIASVRCGAGVPRRPISTPVHHVDPSTVPTCVACRRVLAGAEDIDAMVARTAARKAVPAAAPVRCLDRYAYALRAALENMRDAAAYDAANGARYVDGPFRYAEPFRYVLGADGLPTNATVARADDLARAYMADGTSTYCPTHPTSVGTDH